MLHYRSSCHRRRKSPFSACKTPKTMLGTALIDDGKRQNDVQLPQPDDI
jgi:hypothetical protein